LPIGRYRTAKPLIEEELTTLSAELVSRRADVLISSPTFYIRVLKRMSADIPIVMIWTPDPVEHEFSL
jgi:hypothetical protein